MQFGTHYVSEAALFPISIANGEIFFPSELKKNLEILPNTPARTSDTLSSKMDKKLDVSLSLFKQIAVALNFA